MKINLEKPKDSPSVDGQAKLDWIRKYNIERFGTDDESKIAIIMAKHYENHEHDSDILPVAEEFSANPIENVLEKTEKNPLKKIGHKPKKRIENLKTLTSSQQDRANRGQIRDTLDKVAGSYPRNATNEDIYEDTMAEDETKEGELVELGEQYENDQNKRAA